MLKISNAFILLSLLLIWIPTANAIIIDEFEGTQEAESGVNQENFSSSMPPLTKDGKLSIVGGSRKISVEGLAGSSKLKTRALLENGKLFHSQDVSSAGITKIIWDGDVQQNSINVQALQNFNLTADGTKKILVGIKTFDSPANNQITFEFRIYNGQNPAIQRRSIIRAITKSTDLEFPLNDFRMVANSNQLPDFQKVTSMELVIYGLDPDSDLQLTGVKTDACQFFPNTSNQVIDACGVCNGNGTSCKDCKGVINGSAKIDRCGVCAGAGNSCLACTTKDQSPILALIDNTAQNQEALANQIAAKILKIKNTPTLVNFVNKQKQQANLLALQIWQTVWKLPTVNKVCQNQQFCTSSSTQTLTSSINQKILDLKIVVDTLLAKLKLLQEEASPAYKQWKQKNQELSLICSQELGKVAATHSTCS